MHVDEVQVGPVLKANQKPKAGQPPKGYLWICSFFLSEFLENEVLSCIDVSSFFKYNNIYKKSPFSSLLSIKVHTWAVAWAVAWAVGCKSPDTCAALWITIKRVDGERRAERKITRDADKLPR